VADFHNANYVRLQHLFFCRPSHYSLLLSHCAWFRLKFRLAVVSKGCPLACRPRHDQTALLLTVLERMLRMAADVISSPTRLKTVRVKIFNISITLHARFSKCLGDRAYYILFRLHIQLSTITELVISSFWIDVISSVSWAQIYSYEFKGLTFVIYMIFWEFHQNWFGSFRVMRLQTLSLLQYIDIKFEWWRAPRTRGILKL